MKSKYLIKVSYTPDGVKGLMKETVLISTEDITKAKNKVTHYRAPGQ